MATTQAYLDYVLERIPRRWTVRSRKMFGEYMIYLNEKPAVLVCDNTVFVKKLPEVWDLMADAPVGLPYEGTKEHYILDLDDGAKTEQVLTVLVSALPMPKPRRGARSRQER